jgi:Rieske Fe-S protein
VVAAGAAGLASAALAACGSDDSGGDEGVIADTADIPEGGGLILAGPKVVLTQPTAGEFRAFSSTCTHQGCQVESVSDGTVNCACHGSRFAIADGSVVEGPAEQPLPEQAIEVTGGQVRLA